jgi:site-specific DNA recombinase
VDDGLSGKLPLAKRPGLAAAVAAVKAGAPGCVFVVYAVSRFIRSQKECWALVDQGGEYALPLVSASEPFDLTTAMGRAFLGMLATFAALESDLASERTTDALAAAKFKGTKLGAPRMEDVLPAETIETVKTLYSTGNYSHRSLAAELNERRIPTAQGKQWHPRTVRVALGATVAE